MIIRHRILRSKLSAIVRKMGKLDEARSRASWEKWLVDAFRNGASAVHSFSRRDRYEVPQEFMAIDMYGIMET